MDADGETDYFSLQLDRNKMVPLDGWIGKNELRGFSSNCRLNTKHEKTYLVYCLVLLLRCMKKQKSFCFTASVKTHSVIDFSLFSL